MGFSRTKFVIVLCLAVFAVATGQSTAHGDGLLHVYFFNIGQGDAMLIQSPEGKQVLIDGGPDQKIIGELSKVMPFYDRSLDVVMASHPHADHIAGLIEVLRRYDVDRIIQAGEEYRSPEFTTWRQAVADEHAQNIDATAGTVIDLGDGATLAILYPFQSVGGTVTDKPHDDNVVAMLHYKQMRILFTGDMERPVEQTLITNGLSLNADVLKVGHHGSKTSSSESFLAAVQPQAAFIEVGKKNRYGHPSPVVLKRLENFSIPYYRTDTDGTMELTSDGKQFIVKKF